jgi:type VI secretion system protein ImpE
MTAEESVRAGRLDDALADLQGQVRKKPADPRLRVFLFQLLAVRGAWDRALTQLKVAAELDPSTMAMVQTYQEALRCEALRAEVFAGRRTPLLFGEPAEWMALLVEALRLTAAEKFDDARELREKAFEGAPATPGQIDDQPFAWIADADPRLGPVLEAVVNGRYYWIPFSRLREIRIEKPQDLRDVAWMPAHLTLANGGDAVALIPTRYPGSEAATDPRLVMARSTEWIERPGPTFLGLGQRLLTTDQGDNALMDIRVIRIDSPEADAEGDPLPEPPDAPSAPEAQAQAQARSSGDGEGLA